MPKMTIARLGLLSAGLLCAATVLAQVPTAGQMEAAGPTSRAAAQGGFTANIQAETNAMIRSTDRANHPVRPTEPGTPNAAAPRAHEQPHR
ncbi:MAG: hypothetical protein JOY99_12715 [Sphingomonadaceae bacterium]|nr:hypothetical protein [Sphingomonadaceae bacterium]